MALNRERRAAEQVRAAWCPSVSDDVPARQPRPSRRVDTGQATWVSGPLRLLADDIARGRHGRGDEQPVRAGGLISQQQPRRVTSAVAVEFWSSAIRPRSISSMTFM
jgi:hypothetical protein